MCDVRKKSSSTSRKTTIFNLLAFDFPGRLSLILNNIFSKPLWFQNKFHFLDAWQIILCNGICIWWRFDAPYSKFGKIQRAPHSVLCCWNCFGVILSSWKSNCLQVRTIFFLHNLFWNFTVRKTLILGISNLIMLCLILKVI